VRMFKSSDMWQQSRRTTSVETYYICTKRCMANALLHDCGFSVIAWATCELAGCGSQAMHGAKLCQLAVTPMSPGGSHASARV